MRKQRKKLQEIKEQKNSGKSAIDHFKEEMDAKHKQRYKETDEQELDNFIDQDVDQEAQLLDHQPKKVRIGKARTVNTTQRPANLTSGGAKMDKESKDIMSSLLQKNKQTRPRPVMKVKGGDLQSQFTPSKFRSKNKKSMGNVSNPRDVLAVAYRESTLAAIKPRLRQLKDAPFFIADIIESPVDKSAIYLIGKLSVSKRNVSSCIKVGGLRREIYVLPKIGYTVKQVEEEIKELFQSKGRSVKKLDLELTHVQKKYCFELDVDNRNQNNDVLQISYSFSHPPVKWLKQVGRTFKGVIGMTYTPVELFMMRRQINGPVWVHLHNLDFSNEQHYTNEYLNGRIHSYENDVRVHKGSDLAPPMCLATFELTINPESKNIDAILMAVYSEFNIYNSEYTSVDYILWKDKNVQNEFFRAKHDKRSNKKYKLLEFNTEYEMLNNFYSVYSKLNVDILMGHELYSSSLNVLADKFEKRGKNTNNVFSILLEENRSNNKNNYGGNFRHRNTFTGKLLVDTYTQTKDLVKLQNYSLDAVTEHFFGAQLPATDPIKKMENNSLNVIKISSKMQMLALTLQLSRVAGCLWHLSLDQARSRRNEVLLMHQFYRNNYIVPDKPKFIGKDKKDKKDKFLGGKVLEPKAGFYDNYIILVDFNSLYPSIIRQYQICFTTVLRDFKNPGTDTVIKDNSVIEEDDGDIIDPNSQIELNADSQPLLPEILTYLIQKRKSVKQELKKAKNEAIRSQLDTKQLAFKLIANSIYGCLGFPYSRFYAKKMAMLVTCFGRKLLDSSIKKVEELGYDVIYGDTDSIMINTRMGTVEEAIVEGFDIKKEINKQFHRANNQQILEVELDGVYKKLLLLKKKKYAGLLVKNYASIMKSKKLVVEETELEVKGLDLVRRDWSKLTKEVSKKVLEILMDTGDLIDVDLYLKRVNQALAIFAGEKIKITDNEEIPININISHFILKKQLNKKPDDYPQATNFPHVKVANDMKKLYNKTDAQLVRHFIPFVITTTEGGLSDKALHPQQFQDLEGKAVIDVEYYKKNQLLNPLQRILEHIEGFSEASLRNAFGIRGHEAVIAQNDSHVFLTKIIDRAKEELPLIYNDFSFNLDLFKTKCLHCKTSCWGFYHKCTGEAIGDKEPFSLAEYNRRINNVIRRLANAFSRPNFTCPKCAFSTKIESYNKNCPSCGTETESDGDKLELLANLEYLRRLVETTVEIEEEARENGFRVFVDKVGSYIENTSYERDNLAEAFKLYHKQYFEEGKSNLVKLV